jgi:predicted DsbA family dithiol-disulfide isomerase
VELYRRHFIGGAKVATEHFYTDHLLSRGSGLHDSVEERPVGPNQATRPIDTLSLTAVAAMKVDFISDVTCPWCAIGLVSLEQAIARLAPGVPVELTLQPYELNPGMPPEGEDIAHYATRKYGSTSAELAARQTLIRQRAAEVGLQFGLRTRVWNTFDAHRLLHWAGLEGRQRELKHALLAAYHVRGENPAAPEVLLRAAVEAELDVSRAREVLQCGEFGDAVRTQVLHWSALGIRSVPSVVIDGRHLIQGAQSAEVFEQALREIAAAPARN